jgi:hypothetical protein
MKSVLLVVSMLLVVSVLALGFGCGKPAPAPATAPKPAPAPSPKPTPAPAPKPVVKKPDEIKVGFVVDITKGYTWGKHILKGAQDYFEMTNKAGGIDGVPVKLLWADTKSDATLIVQSYKKFKMDGAVMMYLIGSPHMNAVKATSIEDMMPCIVQSIGVDIYFPPTPNIYTLHATDASWAISVLTPFLELWKESHDRPLKLGIMMADSSFCLPSIPSLKAWCEDNGVELMGIEKNPVPAMEVKASLLRLKEKGVDAISCHNVVPFAWRTIRDMG